MSIYDLNAYEVIREEDLSDLKSKPGKDLTVCQ